MPVYIKARKTVCSERAKNDTEYYYSMFRDLLVQNSTENNIAESRQQILRLERWLREYTSYAYRYHMENFVQANDLYLNEHDAEKFSYMKKIPKAPFIEVFDELPNVND